MKLEEAKHILNKNGYILKEGLSEPDEPKFQNKLYKNKLGTSYPEFELSYYDKPTDEEIEFTVAADFYGGSDIDIEQRIYIDPEKYSQETIKKFTPIILDLLNKGEFDEELEDKLEDYYLY